MSNSHEGVSCDNCMKSNFSGKRYKCLICYDFDLCSACYDQSKAHLNNSSNPSSSSSTSSIQESTSANKHKKTTGKIGKSAPAITSINPPVSNNIQINQSSHLNTHAMQCILTRSDHELFYGTGGGGASTNEQQSFTCPYCSKCGFSETSLCKHLGTQHTAESTNSSTTNQMVKKEVVCPICAVLPNSNGGDPNHLTDNLLQHINLEHVINNTKNGNKNLDDTLNDIGIGSLNGTNSTGNSSNAAAAAAAALRFSRRLNYSQNTSRSSLASQSGITIGNSTGRANGSSINRYAFQFGQNGGGVGSGGLTGANALSSFMRSTSSGGAGLDNLSSSLSNQMDPIAELLSQLTGVRRAATSSNSTNNQLQQLQAQLNRERESLQQQSAAAAVIAAATANGQSTGPSTRHHHLHHHLFSGSGLGANLTKSQLLNSLASSKTNNQNSNNQAAAANQAIQAANNITNAFANQVLELPPNYLFTQTATPRDPRYLLSKYDFNNGENQPPNTNINQINQSIFINDILMLILSKQLNLNDSSTSDTRGTECGGQQNSNANTASNLSRQTSQIDDLTDELIKSSLQASSNDSDFCIKSTKSNSVTSDDPKLMEL